MGGLKNFLIGAGTGILSLFAANGLEAKDAKQIETPDYEFISAVQDPDRTIDFKIGERYFQVRDQAEDGFVSSEKNYAGLSVMELTDIKGFDKVTGNVEWGCGTSGGEGFSAYDVKAKKAYMNELKKGRKFIVLTGLEGKINLPDEAYNFKKIGDFNVEPRHEPNTEFGPTWDMRIKYALGLEQKEYMTFIEHSESYTISIYDEKTNRMCHFISGTRDDNEYREFMSKVISYLPEIFDKLGIEGKIVIDKSLVTNETANKLGDFLGNSLTKKSLDGEEYVIFTRPKHVAK